MLNFEILTVVDLFDQIVLNDKGLSFNIYLFEFECQTSPTGKYPILK